MKLNGHEIEIDNLDKTFFPKAKIDKREFVDYYKKISKYMLPHIKDRPLNMLRAPDGLKGERFYQQGAPDYFPKWIKQVKIKRVKNGHVGHVVCNNQASLVYLADQACITPHAWLSRTQHIKKPDKIVFDLDPPRGKFSLVRFAALQFKEFFDELKINSFVMTTGSRGFHVVVPIKPEAEFDKVRKTAKNISKTLAENNPKKLTVLHRKKKRRGRLFLDYLRNSFGQTSVPPYAVRLRQNAPIATPLDWDEAADSEITSTTYTINNIFRRLSQKKDPWKRFNKKQNRFKKLAEQVKKLVLAQN